MSNFSREPSLPAYRRYPNLQHLGENGPAEIKNYLIWMMDDKHPERLESATLFARHLGIQLDFLTIYEKKDASGATLAKKEMNFFRPRARLSRANKGGHSHARDTWLTSFIHPADRQVVSYFDILPPEVHRLLGWRDHAMYGEFLLAALTKVDYRNGGVGPRYMPLALESRVARYATVDVRTLATQRLPSPLPHRVEFEGDHVGVTVLSQGPLEGHHLNNFEGFQFYKRYTSDQSRRITDHQESVRAAVAGTGGYVAATSIILREDLGWTAHDIEEQPTPISQENFAATLLGGIDTLGYVERWGVR